MTSIHAYDPASGIVPPELPSTSIANLAVGLVDVLSDAEDLPQPRYVAVSEAAQRIDLQFPDKQPSLGAIGQWARRFGTAVTTEPHDSERGPRTYVVAAFNYSGITIEAYAFIPAEPAST